MNHCRDCSKCTERGMWRDIKRAGNFFLIVGTFGISVVVSRFYRSGLKQCRVCGHPLAWHSKDSAGRFLD